MTRVVWLTSLPFFGVHTVAIAAATRKMDPTGYALDVLSRLRLRVVSSLREPSRSHLGSAA